MTSFSRMLRTSLSEFHDEVSRMRKLAPLVCIRVKNAPCCDPFMPEAVLYCAWALVAASGMWTSSKQAGFMKAVSDVVRHVTGRDASDMVLNIELKTDADADTAGATEWTMCVPSWSSRFRAGVEVVQHKLDPAFPDEHMELENSIEDIEVKLDWIERDNNARDERLDALEKDVKQCLGALERIEAALSQLLQNVAAATTKE